MPKAPGGLSAGRFWCIEIFRYAKASPFGSNNDDRRQRRKQGGVVGAAASRMRGPHQGPKQTLGAATRRDVEERRCSVQPLSLTSFDKAGLRHPASAALRLRLAGRCPNNSSLFPPLAVVVAVAPGRGASGEEAKRYGMPKPPLLGEVARRSRDGEVVRRKA